MTYKRDTGHEAEGFRLVREHDEPSDVARLTPYERLKALGDAAHWHASTLCEEEMEDDTKYYMLEATLLFSIAVATDADEYTYAPRAKIIAGALARTASEQRHIEADQAITGLLARGMILSNGGRS